MTRSHCLAAALLASGATLAFGARAEGEAPRKGPSGYDVTVLAQGNERQELTSLLDAAFAAIQSEDYARAEALLALADAHRDVATAEERADLHYGHGLVAYERGNWVAARTELQATLAARPGDPSAQMALGRVYEAEGDTSAAEHAYEGVLTSQPATRQATQAKEALSALYGLPDGLSLLAASGTGFDSNAAQSGTTEVTGTGSAGGTDSWFQSAIVEASYAFRTSRRLSLGPYYSGNAVVLLHSAVQSLSLQVHELGARLDFAPGAATRLRFEAGGASVLSGIDPISTFAWEGVGSTQAEVATSQSSQARLSLSVRGTSATELDYLSGYRIDAGLGERWQLGAWRFGPEVLARYNSVGVAQTRLHPQASVACTDRPQCENGPPYFIPLSYFGTGGGVSVTWNALERLRFSLRGTLEWRRYTEASGRPNERDTQQIREDWRFRARVGGELAIDDEQRFWLTLDNGLFTSSSNLAFDPNNTAHALDYANRNFVQNITELGIQVIL